MRRLGAERGVCLAPGQGQRQVDRLVGLGCRVAKDVHANKGNRHRRVIRRAACEVTGDRPKRGVVDTGRGGAAAGIADHEIDLVGQCRAAGHREFHGHIVRSRARIALGRLTARERKRDRGLVVHRDRAWRRGGPIAGARIVDGRDVDGAVVQVRGQGVIHRVLRVPVHRGGGARPAAADVVAQQHGGAGRLCIQPHRDGDRRREVTAGYCVTPVIARAAGNIERVIRRHGGKTAPRETPRDRIARETDRCGRGQKAVPKERVIHVPGALVGAAVDGAVVGATRTRTQQGEGCRRCVPARHQSDSCHDDSCQPLLHSGLHWVASFGLPYVLVWSVISYQ